MGKLKDTLRNTINSLNDFRYHDLHRKTAMGLLEKIEKERGKTNTKYIKSAKDYAKEVLGSKKYAPWLYVYSAIAGKFKEGWIPDNYYGKIVIPKMTGDYNLSERNKITNLLLNPSKSIDLAYYINNLFWDTNNKSIDEKHIIEQLFKNNQTIVYKIENSLQGGGVFFFDRENFKIDKIKALGNGVFQSFIKQHNFFSEFSKRSVATLRLTSICNNSGSIEVKASFLRLGRNNDTHVKSISAIKIPVDIKNGELSKYGYYTDWTTTELHPDSKITFANKKIPFFEQCLSEVTRMHNRIPYVRSIGWDVIVDETNNFQLIEWNAGHNDIKFTEATQGPCFKDLHWEKLRF
jgi:hypothetical protein